MSKLEFVVPEALLPPDFLTGLLRGIPLPNLDFLAAHAIDAPEKIPPLDTSLTTWQAWLLRHAPTANIAEAWALACGRAPLSGTTARWLAEPVHLQVGLDSIVLADPAELRLDDSETGALAEAIRPVLEADGWRLDCALPNRWFIERVDGRDLCGATVERAIGRHIEPWLPTITERSCERTAGGDNALSWRRTANEIQMIWYTHPVNRAREERGLPTANALWLSGNGLSPATSEPFALPYGAVRTTLPFIEKLASADTPERQLETFDEFILPARRQDWLAWQDALRHLEARAGEVIRALRLGHHTHLFLVLCGEETVHAVTIARTDFWKFWRRGQAAELLAES